MEWPFSDELLLLLEDDPSEIPPLDSVAYPPPDAPDFDDVADVEAVPALASDSPDFNTYDGIKTVSLVVVMTFFASIETFFAYPSSCA